MVRTKTGIIFSLVLSCILLISCVACNHHPSDDGQKSDERGTPSQIPLGQEDSQATDGNVQNDSSPYLNEQNNSTSDGEETVLSDTSTSELIDKFTRSDGAGAESTMSEIMRRFLQNPEDFLNNLSQFDTETQNLIARELGSSIFYWSNPEDTALWEKAKVLPLDDTASELLGEIYATYMEKATEELPSFSYEKLFDFFCSADGAYSESAMTEIAGRFLSEPIPFLSALAGASAKEQELIAEQLGFSLYYDYNEDAQDVFKKLKGQDLDNKQNALLSSILEPYEASAPQESANKDTEPSIADDSLVNVLEYIPSLYVDLKYATKNNFTGSVIYDSDDALLRYGTVKKLAEIQEYLLSLGYSLKIWDAYRPVSAQYKMWELYPDAKYVSDPSKGYSGHCRGNTVDLTLVQGDGSNIEMPSEFDAFSALADRDYTDVSAEAKKNAQLLEDVMQDYGFKGYSAEWWHYTDIEDYPVIKDN